jgi:hypothetical protein
VLHRVLCCVLCFSGYFSAFVVEKAGDRFSIEWPTAGEGVCGQFDGIACSTSLEDLFTAMKNGCTHTCKRCLACC